MEDWETCHANMPVYCLDASISSWDKELRVDEFLYGKNDTVLDFEADRRANDMIYEYDR